MGNLLQTARELEEIESDEDIRVYRANLLKSIRRYSTPLAELSRRNLVGSVSLLDYKERVRKGLYRYNPAWELRVINRLRDGSKDDLSPADRRYLERRYRKISVRLESPSAYQKARGGKGGRVTVWERKSYQGFKIAEAVLGILETR